MSAPSSLLLATPLLVSAPTAEDLANTTYTGVLDHPVPLSGGEWVLLFQPRQPAKGVRPGPSTDRP